MDREKLVMTIEINDSIAQKIQQMIDDHAVILFMKGTKLMPQCGFSAQVVHIMNLLEVNYKDVNVLEDPQVRQGIKDFSDWPTIPQLYIKGEFIGGCDIVTQMYESGQLKQLMPTQ